LAVTARGTRLAKRDGAVTLRDLAAEGVTPDEVLSGIARSLGLAEPGERVELATLLSRFDPSRLPREP
jgi:glutamyl-tRNA synthetase